MLKGRLVEKAVLYQIKLVLSPSGLIPGCGLWEPLLPHLNALPFSSHTPLA